MRKFKKLKISSIIDYGRRYDGCSGESGEDHWFLDLDSLEIYDRGSLIRDYGLTDEILSDEMTLQYTYRFVPMFGVNVIEKIRLFFDGMNNRQISKEIKNLNPDQLDIYFEEHMELNQGDRRRWTKYENQFLTEAAVEWCESLHIPYVL